MIGYFLMADVLGFSKIVQNLPDDVLADRVEGWVQLVERNASRIGISSFQLISDTLFVSTESSSAGLSALIEYARCLLSEGLAQSLPIRGAIVHGGYKWGKLTYGKTVVRAHNLEMAQDWVGITCDSELPHLSAAWGYESLVRYPPPFKSGRIALHPVVSWDVPSFRAIVRMLCSQGLTKANDVLDWNWGRKVNNTAQFGYYLRLLRRANENPRNFYGRSPLETVELELFGGNDVREQSNR